MTASNLADAAIELASGGWYVFPLAPGGKEPLTKTGVKEATDDLAQVEAWWSAHPQANIGLAPDPSGMFVVDPDVKNGQRGVENFCDAWRNATGVPFEPSMTLIVTTPSGGWHVYFRGHTGNSRGNLPADCDLRGENGYVIAPPSIIDGNEYRANGEFARDRVNSPPTWLSAAISAPRERDADAGEWRCEPDLPANVAAFTDWLINDALTATAFSKENGKSGGNETLVQTFWVARDWAISEALAVELMNDHWNDRCDPPWEMDDLERIVKSSYSNAQRAAGCKSKSVLPPAMAALATMTTEELNEYLEAEEAEATDYWLGKIHVEKDIRKKLGKLKWLVPDLVEERSLTTLIGPYGSMKTFVALDLALCMATGLPFAGRGDTDPIRVLFIAGEGAHGIPDRIDAWKELRGMPDIPIENFHLLGEMPIMTSDRWEPFVGIMVNEFQPGAIFFDTLSRTMIGVDEDKATAMNMVVSQLAVLQREIPGGCANIVIHHTGKDEAKGARGSNALTAAVDTELRLSKTESGDNVTLLLKLHKIKNIKGRATDMKFHAREVGASVALEYAPVVEEGQPTPGVEYKGDEIEARAQKMQSVVDHRASVEQHMSFTLRVLREQTRPMFLGELRGHVAFAAAGNHEAATADWATSRKKGDAPEWSYPDRKLVPWLNEVAGKTVAYQDANRSWVFSITGPPK